MTTETLRPTSNVTATWSTYDYTNIDDAVSQPSTSGDGTSVYQGRNDDFEPGIWGFDSLASLTSITSVTVWVRHQYLEDDEPIVENALLNAKIGGSWQGDQTINTSASGKTWVSHEFTGTWSASDFDDFEVSLNAGSVGNADDYEVSVVYADVVGTAGPSVPDAPTSLSATATAHNAIDLSWSAPGDDGGASITGYKIERKVGAGSWSDLVADTGTTSTTYSDTGLTAETLYTYRVSAINSEGAGSASSEASDTTDAAPIIDSSYTSRTSIARSGENSGQLDVNKRTSIARERE